jgi:hypothetical protein
MIETPGLRPARLISAPSIAIFSPPLLLRPFATADRVDPLAERTAADIGMARRGAGTQRLPPQFVGLDKAAGERATDFLGPLTRKRVHRLSRWFSPSRRICSRIASSELSALAASLAVG